MKKMSAQSCIVLTIFAILFSTLYLSPVEAVSTGAGAGGATVQKPKFDILEILSSKATFKTFVNLLNQTGLAKEINARDTITVLAVGDGAIGGLASKSLSRIKDILSTHVILDYYGDEKLSELSPKKNTTVTTMYQATGVASDMQGYLKIVVLPNHGTKLSEKIRIGSAAKGAPFDVQLVSDTAFDYKKYDYVIQEVSGVIFTPGIDGLIPPPSYAPKKSPGAPPPSNETTLAPAPSPVDDVDDYEMAPTPQAGSPAPAPGPIGSPSEAADAPTADDVPETTATPPSGSTKIHVSSTHILVALFVVLVSSFASAGL